MSTKENSLNQIKNIKISKNAILENDKKLLMYKLGFNNLSRSNLTEEPEKQNISNKNKNNTPNLKIESKNVNKSSSFLIKIKKRYSNINHFKKKKLKTYQNIKRKENNNNISTNSSNERINKLRIKKPSKSIINLSNNNKSYSILPIKPLINTKTMMSNSVNKKKSKEVKNNNNKKNNINSFKTTTTHTIKTNLTNGKKNSISEISFICQNSKLIKNFKNLKKHSIDKLSCTMNTPGLLAGLKNQKIKNKEKSYKIFNDNLYIKNNIHHNNNINGDNIKIKFKGRTGKNSPIRNYRYIIDSFEKKNILSFSKEKNNEFINRNKNCKNKRYSSYTQINYIGRNKNNILRKSIISVSNENSEDTRKESCLDLHKIFNEKVNINYDKSDVINEIIQKNMKLKFNDNNDNKMRNQNKLIDQSITDNDNKNSDKQKHLNYFNNLIKNNDEPNKNLNDSTKNENFSSANENNDNTNKYYKSSKIVKYAQDLLCSQDKNSAQTCATGDKHNKISKYVKQPIYNISQRFILDDITFRSRNKPNKNYKFINDVVIKNKNIPLLDIKKLLKLNDISIYKILSFSYDNYSSIISSNKFLGNKIKKSLTNIFQHVIDDFTLKYGGFLKLINFSFKQKDINNNGKINYLFDLIIECQIITKENKKSYEIGCDYISYDKKYDNKWKFDIQKKEDIKLWLCTELDFINNCFKKFTYTSQVSSFCYQDMVKLQFNIFSTGNNISPISIEWSEPIITDSKPYLYQNSSFISSVPFDQLRACEVETQILFWKKNLPEDDCGIINDFKEIFEKFFKIKNISYDISKFYFYKFVIIANKKGVLKQNKFLTFDINIIDYKDNIKNEIQCIYLMNSNYYTKTMDIRIGTYVIFYIIDMKR